MSITLVTGPANSGKAQVVMDAVRRHLAQGAEPILVVPTRTDVEHYLRELAGAQAATGVRVFRFSELLEEIVRRAGVRAPVLGPLARERLLGAVAGERAASQPGFVRALGDLFAELLLARVSPGRLSAALGGVAGGRLRGAWLRPRRGLRLLPPPLGADRQDRRAAAGDAGARCAARAPLTLEPARR